MSHPIRQPGDLIREWRQHRRMSQHDLACDAEISAKQLSFLETGRLRLDREMLLHLASRLAVPLRDCNLMLRAAGLPPRFPERSLDDPDLRHARQGIDRILSVHAPAPALALDRHWTIIATNEPMVNLISGAEPMLLTPPLNFVRLCLHPAGLAPRIINLMEWRHQIIARLRRQIEATGDPVLADLVEELRDYPLPPGPAGRVAPRDQEMAAVPLRLASVHGELAFFSTTTAFNAAVDVTLSELTIEAFFPANPFTGAAVGLLEDGDRPPVTRVAARAAIG